MDKKEHTLGDNKIFAEQLMPDKKRYENTLVFVHGSFGGYWMWNMIAPMLAERGFEILVLPVALVVLLEEAAEEEAGPATERKKDIS